MLKLYKRTGERVTHYHEAWAEDSKIVEHWGPIGDTGSKRDHKLEKGVSPKKAIQRVLGDAIARGFEPIEDEDHRTLLIEYAIQGMGSASDLELRHKLENQMNETLGWTGLGHCDGGSIGSGTMEVCCLVVDFDVAKRVIEEELEDTEFSEFSRIYDEDSPEPVGSTN